MIVSQQAHTLPRWFRGNGPESDVVISTRVRLARCLADHEFPLKASLLEKKNVFKQITGAISDVAQCGSCECVNFSHLDKLDQEFLLESRAVSPDLLSIDGDRGVVYDESYGVSIMVNEEDHVRMQCLDSGFSAMGLWETASSIDDDLGSKLAFAFDTKNGFLTCCPSNSGTGLRVSFLLHLPGLVLTKTVDQVLMGASQMGVSTRGFWGENSAVVGNFFQLSNQATLGATEMQFLDSTQDIIRTVISCERSARDKILKNARLELEDKVFRAYGILLHARTLSVEEFLNLASALRMGVECEIFDKTDVDELNRLTMLCLPAHLQVHEGGPLTVNEIHAQRAEKVRQVLTKQH